MDYKIIIPVYNEERYLDDFLNSFDENILKNTIFVDDGSTDRSLEIISKYNTKILTHEKNLGKGEAMKTGTLMAIKNKADVILFMDADLQHKTEDINRFLSVFKNNKNINIVFGARKIGKNMRLIKFLGNKFLTVTINLLFRYFLNDTQCGFRAFRSIIYNKINWQSKDYSVETEIIVNAAKNNISYKEIEIETIYINHKKGTRIRDGIKIFFKVLLWKIIK